MGTPLSMWSMLFSKESRRLILPRTYCLFLPYVVLLMLPSPFFLTFFLFSELFVVIGSPLFSYIFSLCFLFFPQLLMVFLPFSPIFPLFSFLLFPPFIFLPLGLLFYPTHKIVIGSNQFCSQPHPNLPFPVLYITFFSQLPTATALKMMAAGSSETLVPMYQATFHHIPEDCNLN